MPGHATTAEAATCFHIGDSGRASWSLMAADKMHDDEITIDIALVSTLVAEQFPDWAGLPLDHVQASGTMNAIFRLGEHLSVRLPLGEQWQSDLDKEFLWLPRLAPRLPIPIAMPVARGVPAHGYPFDWSIYNWLEGNTAAPERIFDPDLITADLIGFLDSLQRLDTTDGPRAGPHDRGGLLDVCNPAVQTAIGQLDGIIDTAAAAEVWKAALAAPGWAGPPTWVHGDLWSENVLVDHRGRISGILDFGCLAVGDPAVDMIAAWSLLTPNSLPLARGTVDDASWKRGKGWALSMALIALPYYVDTNPVIVANAQRMIERILADPND